MLRGRAIVAEHREKFHKAYNINLGGGKRFREEGEPFTRRVYK